MSQDNNYNKEETIIFPIQLDPFPYKSVSTENINVKQKLLVEHRNSSSPTIEGNVNKGEKDEKSEDEGI